MRLQYFAWAVCMALSANALAAGIEDEFRGVRSEAMGGAHRGVGTSNDTLYLNPAGMALFRRYSVEVQYGYSPFDKLTTINASAVDSKSSPVAAGIGYTHVRGDKDGVDAGLHRFYFGAAYAISQHLAFGVTNRYVRGSYNDEKSGERQHVDFYTGDIGIMAALAQGLSFGLSYNNVVRTDMPLLARPTLGAGLGLGNSVLTLAGDVELDVRKVDSHHLTYRAGVEYFAGGAFPLRLGYAREPFRKTTGARSNEDLITAGVAWVTKSGAIDLTYKQSFERRRNWAMAAALQFFL